MTNENAFLLAAIRILEKARKRGNFFHDKYRIGTSTFMFGGTEGDIAGLVNIAKLKGIEPCKSPLEEVVERVYREASGEAAVAVTDTHVVLRPEKTTLLRVLYSDVYGAVIADDALLPSSSVAEIFWAGGGSALFAVPMGETTSSKTWQVLAPAHVGKEVADIFGDMAKSLEKIGGIPTWRG